MTHINASINPSPTIVGERSKKIENVANTFVKFNEQGKLEQATAGEVAMGIVISCVEDDDVLYSVQVKDIGLVLTGEEIKLGDAIAVGENGKAVKAKSTNFIMGYCTGAAKEGALAEIQITKSGKEA